MNNTEITKKCINLYKMLKDADEVRLYHAAESIKTSISMGPMYYDAAAAMLRQIYSAAIDGKIEETVREETSRLHEILTGSPLIKEESE